MNLDGKRIAILVAPRGIEEPGFAEPKTGGGTVRPVAFRCTAITPRS